MDEIDPATDGHGRPGRPARTAGPRLRRRTAVLLPAALGAVLLAGAVGLGAQARLGAGDRAPGAAAAAERLEQDLQPLVDAGYPAVLASVTGPDGERVDVGVGAGDLEQDEPVPVDGEVRVGSNTKPVVAVLVLQLAQEGLVDLDEPVETYLPGLLTGEGVDGAAISVRRLLQHTSGLPEYADQVAADAFAVRDVYTSPRDVLDVALGRPAASAPGERWQYSNTNYLLLGLLVERVTGRPLHEQVDERIVQPLGLQHTYLPAPGERTLRGEHPEGYHVTTAGELAEITAMDTSWAWAAGALVSTPSELNTFMQAALDGTLLSAGSLAELRDAVPSPDELTPGSTYGLGWQSYPLSCGGTAWGHGGDIPGTQTRNAVGPDGTAVTIAVTALPWAVVDPDDEERLTEYYRLVIDALDRTLCRA